MTRAKLSAMTWIWAAALLLFGVSLVYAGLGGVRGADQYWYVADVETLITSGQNQTNNIFPVTLLSGQRIPPPFVHNILSLYLAALPALFLGSFWGWLALNLVSTLLCCYLIYKTCMRVTNTLFAQLASLFYLLFPVTLWQTSQPLAEASIAALVALGLYLLACADNGLRSWLAVASAAGLSYLARESLVLLLIAVPLGYVACGLSERGQRWWRVTSAGRQLAILMAHYALRSSALARFSLRTLLLKCPMLGCLIVAYQIALTACFYGSIYPKPICKTNRRSPWKSSSSS